MKGARLDPRVALQHRPHARLQRGCGDDRGGGSAAAVLSASLLAVSMEPKIGIEIARGGVGGSSTPKGSWFDGGGVL